MLTGAFFHDGVWSSFRRRHHGRPVDTASLPGWKFLGYLQDHDQIGNRAVGDRISATLSPGLLAVGATLVLTSPFTPMLFMGEEWGARTPWQFFTSHPEPELGQGHRRGADRRVRRARLGRRRRPRPAGPGDLHPLEAGLVRAGPGAARAAARRAPGAAGAAPRRTPTWSTPTCRARPVSWDDADRWLVVHRGSLRVVVNLAEQPREIDLDVPATDVLFATGELPALDGDTVTLPAESAAVLATR